MSLSNWTYRKKITIDHTKIDTDLIDFPILIKLTATNFDFTKALSTGYDIRFTSSDKTTLLKYERERHDSINSLGEYWVKIPLISSTVDTNFYIYYDNTLAVDEADPTNVWDTNMIAVYHMKDLTPSSIKDSTINANNGIKLAANAPIEVDGKIAKAQSFIGASGQYIDAGKSLIGLNQTFTIIAWIYANSANYYMIASEYDDVNNDFYFMTFSGLITIKIIHTDGSYTQVTTATAFTPTSWHQVGVTVDIQNSQILFIVDGIIVQTNSVTGGLIDGGATFRIGWAGIDSYTFGGKIDEVEIFNNVLSAAYIKASYNSGNDSLETYGIEETTIVITTVSSSFSLLTRLVQHISSNFSLLSELTFSIIRQFNFISDLKKNITKEFNFISRITNKIINNFSILSDLKKNIKTSFSILSDLKKNIINEFNFISRIVLRIKTSFSILSDLRKTWFSSFSFITYLFQIGRSFTKGFLQWNLVGSIVVGSNELIPLISNDNNNLQEIWIYCKTLGTGTVKLDIKRDGISIFNLGNEPIINTENKVIIKPDILQTSTNAIYSLDILSADTGFADISIILVFETLISINPRIEKIVLFEDNFPTSLENEPYTSWISNKFKIRIYFNCSMKSNNIPIITVLPLDDEQTFLISGGSWSSTEKLNDTFTSNFSSLNSNNIGKFLINIQSISYFDNSLNENIEIELLSDNPVTILNKYTNNGNINLLFTIRSAEKFSFSMDNINWSNPEDFKTTKIVNITDTIIGGNIINGDKILYVKFIHSSSILIKQMNVSYYSGSLVDFSYYHSINTDRTILTIFYKYSSSFLEVPMDKMEILINGELIKTVNAQTRIISGFTISQITGYQVDFIGGTIFALSKLMKNVNNFTLTFETVLVGPRIDLVYYDLVTNQINIIKGIEGNSTTKIPYESEFPIPNTNNLYPVAPTNEVTQIPLFYIYLNAIETNLDYPNPPPEISQSFNKTFSLRDTNFLSITIEMTYLNKQINIINIEQIDLAGRSIIESFNIIELPNDRQGRVQGYLDSGLTQEILSGTIIRQDSIWTK